MKKRTSVTASYCGFAALLAIFGTFPCQASNLNLDILNPSRIVLPNGVETYAGTVTNNTGAALLASDLLLNFSGYNPLFVTLNQL
ncbi:MAG: hypothetical protein JWO48_697 [Bryobacterales bacterium]|nr:hypothetical protein [Bryobacterales bacterium]